MKGLYLNAPRATDYVARTDADLETVTSVENLADDRGNEVTAANHGENWPDGAIQRVGADWAAGAGWIVTGGGSLGDLRSMLAARGRSEVDLIELLEGSVGSYQLLISIGGRLETWSDGFGTHPHYVRSISGRWSMAPAPTVISDGVAEDPIARAELLANGYLFGVKTVWPEIKEVHPGSVDRDDGSWRVWRRPITPCPLPLLRERICEILRKLPARADILPLSGGFDSRLVLSGLRPNYAYTFGPNGSRERTIAAALAHRVDRYHGFELSAVPRRPKALRRAKEMLDGTFAHAFYELVDVYRLVQEETGPGRWFYDGHLGDVLQRGTYYIPRQLGRRLHWLLRPVGYTKSRTFEDLVQGTLGAGSAPPSLEDAREEKASVMSTWNVTASAQYALFQALYGRGRRHILVGGGVLAHQFFSPVQFFWQREVPDTFFDADPALVIRDEAFRALWRGADRELLSLPHNKGPLPLGNATMNRIRLGAVFAGKKLGVKRFYDYGQELPKIREQAAADERLS